MLTGQLPKPSIIRPDKIYTLQQDIIVKRIGRITEDIQNSVKKEIRMLLEI
jgi:mRNA-degrading endonuclease toxin of MazEF toxin-antitoxin module